MREGPSLASHDDEAEEEEFAFHYFIPTRNGAGARVFGGAELQGSLHVRHSGLITSALSLPSLSGSWRPCCFPLD